MHHKSITTFRELYCACVSNTKWSIPLFSNIILWHCLHRTASMNECRWTDILLLSRQLILPLYIIAFTKCCSHDYVIKWKHFPRYRPFVRGIHRSTVNPPHKDQWHGALMFTLICARINGWVNNRKAGDLRRHRRHYDVIIMILWHRVCL